jgi:ribokinase
MRAFVLGNYIHAHFMQVERLPAHGESLAASGVFHEHGGKGLNLGVGLHRLGIRVDLLMAVGRDAAGADITRYLHEIGLNTALILPLGENSGFGVGFVTPQGDNFLAAHAGANALLGSSHVAAARAQLHSADWVLAQNEVPEAAILAAFTAARAHDIKTYWNPSPWLGHQPALLQQTDVLVVNETEAGLLFRHPAAETMSRADWATQLPALAAQLDWCGELLVVTLAHAGCVALSRDGVVTQPAFEIQQVDATGAGDAFACGLIWALLRGCDVPQALRCGNACGAEIAARHGVLPHLPSAAQLADYALECPLSSVMR